MHALADVTTGVAPRKFVRPGAETARRTDNRTARIVYRAQVLHRSLGHRAAKTFMDFYQVSDTISSRILFSPARSLRR